MGVEKKIFESLAIYCLFGPEGGMVIYFTIYIPLIL